MSRILIELHCHTKDHSFDGLVSADVLLREYIKNQFSGVVFTDHSYCWPAEELAELRERLGLPDSFFLASGQEVRTYSADLLVGDLLVFGVQEPLIDGMDVREVFAKARENSGFCIAPHPGTHGGMQSRLGDYPVVAAETWNSRYGSKVAKESRRLANEFEIPEFGGSDSHKLEDIALGGTIFPRLPTNLDDIHKMLSAGLGKAWRPLRSYLR